MNTINFNQTGGFPLSTDILNQLQANYQIFSALGSFAGNLGILIGCEDVGGKVMPGVMIINGEIIEFEGGLLSDNVIISETLENKIFEDGQAKPTIVSRVAIFGNSLNAYPWADFYRVKTQKSLVDRIKALEDKPNPIPIGLVAIWNKPSNIPLPLGWQEVVDLKGKLPAGILEGDSDFGTIGQTGGGKSQAILKTHLPAVGVGYQFVEPGTPDWGGGGFDGGGNKFARRNATTSNMGDGTELPILNPYRVVRFIEYVG